MKLCPDGRNKFAVSPRTQETVEERLTLDRRGQELRHGRCAFGRRQV
jgi:hypothetical protein